MIWFTSDLHLGHRSAITMCERPFDTVEEMNRTLICNFNACVKKNDTVYILGDIAHKMPVVEDNQLIRKLNGKKKLCKGNHDKEYDSELFEGIYDFLEIAVQGMNISLMHYPMMSWPKSCSFLFDRYRFVEIQSGIFYVIGNFNSYDKIKNRTLFCFCVDSIIILCYKNKQNDILFIRGDKNETKFFCRISFIS